MAFVTNPRRDASPTITGFVYQVNITILCWRELQEGEHLELEGARTSTPYKVTPMSRTRSRKHIHGHATHRTCKSPQRRISRALDAAPESTFRVPPYQSGRAANSSASRRARSARISIWAIFPSLTAKRRTLDSRPPGAHTAPNAPSTRQTVAG